MVIYYINKVSEKLADYRYPIKEGDICMLYDGETVKTIYVDSERDTDSIWRDFKFVDNKSLKSYQFPTSDSILCAPIGEKHAIGNTRLLTQLIQECKGEWLLDFLNETSAVLSGFVDYWDLKILRRFTGDEEIKVAYEKEDAISGFLDSDIEDEVVDNDAILDDADVDDQPKSYDIRWFCISVLACLEGLMDNRSFQILNYTLKGESRSSIAKLFGLTQERIRQIVAKATKQAKEILIKQFNKLESEREENARLKVQLNLMKEEITRLKTLIPKDVLPLHEGSNEDLDVELVEMLETPIQDILFPTRATNILLYMGLKKFADIPQLESGIKLLEARNSGRKTVHDVSCFLTGFHLTFGMSYSEIIDTLKTTDWRSAKKRWIREKDNRDSITENNKSEEAFIVLTKDIIEAARTPNGGFTKSQLAAIGIAWPPPIDWIKEKVGTMITPTQLEEFKLIKYIKEPSLESSNVGQRTYKDVALSSQDERRMKAILQAMTEFFSPVTPNVIACTIDTNAWGNDSVVSVDIVDSILKRLPEVEYVKWGKYILKDRNRPSVRADKRIGYTVRLFPSQLKGEIVKTRIDCKGVKKLQIKTSNGQIVEIDDLPYLYEVLKRN